MVSSSIPCVTLNNGQQIPKIGYGAGTANFGKECTENVLSALKTGYTYIDAAQQYANSKSIGEALKQWGGKREDLYIVQKFGVDKDIEKGFEPREILKTLLQEMGTSYVDLYLIHCPYYITPRTFAECWKVMEDLQREGLARAIGVSNFREEDILAFHDSWTIPPAVNQIEFNPYVYHAPNMLRLRELCDKHKIMIEGYGPLNSLFRSTGGPVDPIVKRISKEKGMTEAQVLLQWAQRFTGGVVVTTSSNAQRQREQLESMTTASQLTDAEVTEIAEAGKGRFYRHFMGKVWDKAKP